MASMEKRLQKELQALLKDPPVGVNVDTDSIQKNLSDEEMELLLGQLHISRGQRFHPVCLKYCSKKLWIVYINGAPESLYEGENFQLHFKFGSRYPFDSPQVTFIGSNIPVHPHVYSNGHICLSILTEDWSPALSVQAVCLSVVSMLSSCKEKKRPPDNAIYVKTCSKNPKKTRWWYHDDSV